MSPQNDWEIVFVLPNLRLRESYGNDELAIVPQTDPRAVEIISSSDLADAFVNGFEDQFRQKQEPSLLLRSRSAPESLRKIEALVAFRNILGLSSIAKAHEHRLTSTFSAYPLYSDYFDLYPTTMASDETGLLTTSPDLRGFNTNWWQFRGQTSPGLGGDLTAMPDDVLFELLARDWTARFVGGEKDWRSTALFRSLEMAFRASAMPFSNHATIYDFGAHVSLWVSAFEVLSHPRTGKANVQTVVDLLGWLRWSEKKVGGRYHRISYRGKKKRQSRSEALQRAVRCQE